MYNQIGTLRDMGRNHSVSLAERMLVKTVRTRKKRERQKVSEAEAKRRERKRLERKFKEKELLKLYQKCLREVSEAAAGKGGNPQTSVTVTVYSIDLQRGDKDDHTNLGWFVLEQLAPMLQKDGFKVEKLRHEVDSHDIDYPIHEFQYHLIISWENPINKSRRA